MAERKHIAAQRVHKLPVRVLRSTAATTSRVNPALHVAPEPAPRTPAPAAVAVDTRTRTRIAWIGIAVLVAGMVIAWIVTVGSSLAKPGQPNSLWLKIKMSISNAFSGSSKVPTQTKDQQDFQTLDKKVFPNAP